MEIKERVNVGIKIKEIRENKALSRKDLAKKAGMSYDSLGSIENGKVKEIHLNKIIKLSDILKVTLEELIVEKVSYSGV